MDELAIKNITEQCEWRNDTQTLFPEQWVMFKRHNPESDVYSGSENYAKNFVFEVEYKTTNGTDKTRLEVWFKGGDWNENPFYYFCIGQTDAWGELYYIPQLSPYYKKEDKKIPEILKDDCPTCGFDNSETQYKFCPHTGESLVDKESLEEPEEVVEIEPSEENIIKFIKENFLGVDGKVKDKFKAKKIVIDLE